MIDRISADEKFRKLKNVDDVLFVSNYGRLYDKSADEIVPVVKGRNFNYYHLGHYNYEFSRNKISIYNLSLLVWNEAEMMIDDEGVQKPERVRGREYTLNESLTTPVNSGFISNLFHQLIH
jgi:hypothetical protein